MSWYLVMSMKAQSRLLFSSLDVLRFAAAVPFIFILVQPVLTQFVPGPVGWGTVTIYDWQRISSIVGLITMLLMLFAWSGEIGAWLGWRVLILGGVIVAWGVFSLYTNEVPWRDGLHEVGNTALLIVSFWSVRFALAKEEQSDWQRVVVVCFAGSALLYLAVFFSANSDNMFDPKYVADGVWFPVFSNIRFFSDYQALLLPFVLYAVRLCRHPLARIAAWAMVTLFFMLFFYSGSRAVVLGQLGAHLCLLIVLGRRYWPTLYRHGLAWGCAYLLYLLLSVGVPYLLLEDDVRVAILPLMREGLSLREVIWSLAWGDMLSHPWFGIGPGEFSRQFNAIAAAPHNSVLMVGAEWGTPILCLVLAAIFVMISRTLMALRRMATRGEPSTESFEFAIAAWLAFAALLLHSLVANVWVVPVSQLGLLIAASLVFASCLDRPLRGRIKSSVRSGTGFLVLSIAAASTMAWLLLQDVPDLPSRNSAYLNCMRPTPYFSPRFWQQGWLMNECPSPPNRTP